MTVVIQTLVRYFTLTFLLVSGLLFILSISRQDWMREEVKIKYSTIKNIIKVYENMTSSLYGKEVMNKYFSALDNLPSEAKTEVKVHFGLKQSCYMIQFSGFGNPTQVFLPEIKWCVENDFFTEPTKYGMPEGSTNFIEKEVEALKHAYVSMILAIVFVAFALIAVIVKPFKCTSSSIFATVVFAVISCICVVAALALIHDKFDFQEDLERQQRVLKSSQMGGITGSNKGEYGYGYGESSSRKRRDDGSPGYGQPYTTPMEPVRGESRMSNGGSNTIGNYIATQQGMMTFLINMKLNESIGSPLIMAGLGMGSLLLVVILSVVEFLMIKKYGKMDVKYSNVALT